MPRITSKHAAVSEVGSDASRRANRLKELFIELKMQAEAICGEDWKGEAQMMFQAAQTQWNKKADALGDAQGRSGVATVSAADGFAAADRKASGLFQV